MSYAILISEMVKYHLKNIGIEEEKIDPVSKEIAKKSQLIAEDYTGCCIDFKIPLEGDKNND